ncbi:MAG: multicopper oxidase domain-containing protein, partial [Sinobacteraceae bacterium]|nr:multicopper oxidase domain-containing protein [Nevskiaceae bacterium]
GRMLGYGEPLRVRQGARMLLHVVNASASETRHLALPGHAFQVISLDGHTVHQPRAVNGLRLGAGERLSALVTMQTPGVWVLGDLQDSDRESGLGIVVEYAARRGPPRWHPPRTTRWDYLQLSAMPAQQARPPTARLPVAIARVGNARGFSRFTVNGRSFSRESRAAFRLSSGHRYRLHFDNASDSACCLHLTGHPFELVSGAAEWHTGLSKDVLLLERGQRLVADIVARAPGTFLLQCRRQLQRDFGLAARVEVI